MAPVGGIVVSGRSAWANPKCDSFPSIAGAITSSGGPVCRPEDWLPS